MCIGCLRLHVLNIHNRAIGFDERCRKRQDGVFHPKALGRWLLEYKEHTFVLWHLGTKHKANLTLQISACNLGVNLEHACLKHYPGKVLLRLL